MSLALGLSLQRRKHSSFLIVTGTMRGKQLSFQLLTAKSSRDCSRRVVDVKEKWSFPVRDSFMKKSTWLQCSISLEAVLHEHIKLIQFSVIKFSSTFPLNSETFFQGLPLIGFESWTRNVGSRFKFLNKQKIFPPICSKSSLFVWTEAETGWLFVSSGLQIFRRYIKIHVM